MPRVFDNVNSFKSGEIGNELRARFDTTEYKNGHRDMINVFPMKTSGCRGRPSTRYISDLTSFGACRVIPFTTILGDFVLLIRTAADHDHFKIVTTSGSNVTLTNNLDSSSYLAGDHYDGATKEGWRFEVEHINGSPVVILVHSSRDFCPIYASYTVASGWVFDTWVDENIFTAFPYEELNITSTTITPSATTGNITLTASSSLFVSTDVGLSVRVSSGSIEGVALITGYTSATQVDATVIVTMAGTSAYTRWSFPAWSVTNGWPANVLKHNQRLFFFSNTEYPDFVWGSRIKNPVWLMERKLDQDLSSDASGYNYFGAEDNSDAFSVRQAVNGGKAGQNALQWAASGDGLVLGSTLTETVLKGNDGEFGALNKDFDTKTRFGGSDISAVAGGDSIFYVTRDGKELREFIYNRENGSYKNTNLSILNNSMSSENATDFSDETSHIFEELVWQQSRSILWCLNSSGGLVSLTFEPSSETVGWARHRIGGATQVHGIGTLPSDNNTFDDLYMCVQRTIDGSTKYYLEKMGKDFKANSLLLSFSTDDDFPWFLDCGIRVTNSPASTSVSGLSHLEGATVGVWADGYYKGEFTVDTGAITLEEEAEEVIVGFRYNMDFGSHRIMPNAPQGQSPILDVDINRMSIMVVNTFGGSYGQSSDTLDHDIEYDTDDLYTGVLEIDAEFTPDQELTYYFRQSEPYPFTVLGVFINGLVEGGD